ncbi:hypothetical protein KI387_017136, partial [Taxus chinensis]
SKGIVDIHGEVVVRLDFDAICAALRIPVVEDAHTVTLAQEKTLFDHESDGYK